MAGSELVKFFDKEDFQKELLRWEQGLALENTDVNDVFNIFKMIFGENEFVSLLNQAKHQLKQDLLEN